MGKIQNAITVVVKFKDQYVFSHKKQYPLKPEVKEGLKLIIENLKEQGLLIPCNSPSDAAAAAATAAASLQSCPTLYDPRDGSPPEMAAHQDSPSLGFSRQEHRSGMPFPSPI